MVYGFVAAVVVAVLGLKRTCPKCRRDQVVSSQYKHLTVNCKFCGAKIPPRQ